MEAHLASTFSDEEGSPAVAGKLVYIRGTKRDIIDLHNFLGKAVAVLEDAESCHMHFQDFLDSWSKEQHIDLVIEVGQV